MQRIVIVGAGIVGLSTAYALLKQGIQNVTVLEQAAVDHPRGTSHGLSRLLRFEYGPDKFYSQLVQASMKSWRELQQHSSQTLYSPTGLLVLGHERDNFTLPSYRILHELGLPIQNISLKECRTRFPQFMTYGFNCCTYDSEAAILHASTCLQTLKMHILDLGGTICETSKVVGIAHEHMQRPIRLYLESGDEYSAERVVLAVGPWIHHVLDALNLPVRMTRQYLLYFANLPAEDFGSQFFPAFFAHHLYGFPLHSSFTGRGPAWLKVSSHTFGIPVDPDETPIVEKDYITQLRRKIEEVLPAVQNATLAQIESCMYDVTDDEDFILDRLPDDPRIVIGTGLSGHGFKFGPMIGEMLGSLVRETEPPVSMRRFQLARFSRVREHSSVA